MTKQTLGQRISDARKKLGLSQESLGEKLGVSRQAISKWEADGAIPEIDKLISLSRLFGVSVGWLLGQEAAPDQPEPASTPIRTAAQLVRNQLADHPWWRTGCWIVMALALVFLAFCGYLRLSRITDAELRLSIVQSDVDRLEHRIQQLEFLQRAADRSGTLLLGFHFDLAPVADEPEIQVTFTATPRNWQQGDTGWLCVSGTGAQTARIPCQWDGDSLTAIHSLPLADSYELYFVLEHPDGSHQLQLLPDRTMETLKSSFAITAHGSIGSFTFRPGDNTIQLEEFHCSWMRPDVYNDSPVTWQKAEFLLYLDGQPVWQQTEFDAAVTGDSTLTSGGFGRGWGRLQIPLGGTKPEPGQSLELKARVALSNTVTGECTIASWTTDSRGNLQLDTPD